jgi:hypothetical protein
MTTLLKRSKTGLIAIAGSMQLVWHLEIVTTGMGPRFVDIHKMEHRIWHCGIVRFERLEDEEEP